MNTLKNKVQLVGNLGMDPDVRDFDNGKKVARFSLATSETYKNAKGERVKDTQWHNLVAWGPQAKFAELYLKKGHEVMVEGRLTHRSYDDKEGVKKFYTEVIVNQIQSLQKREE